MIKQKQFIPNVGRNLIRIRGCPDFRRILRIIIIGRNVRPLFSKKGQKSVISTEFIFDLSTNEVCKTAEFLMYDW